MIFLLACFLALFPACARFARLPTTARTTTSKTSGSVLLPHFPINKREIYKRATEKTFLVKPFPSQHPTSKTPKDLPILRPAFFGGAC